MAKEISIDDLVGKESTKLVPPKQTNKTKQEEEMKSFFKKPAVISIISVVATLLAVWGAYSLYSFVYNTGYQDAVKEQKAISVKVSELSKTNQ